MASVQQRQQQQQQVSSTQQQQKQQQQQQQPRQPQPAVDKVRQLLYRRLKVVLPSGRVIEGDLTCLDKQGNLILSNACEHIATTTTTTTTTTAAAAGGDGSKSSKGGSGSTSNSSSSSSSQAKPAASTTQLGMVLVPKAQQQEVSLRVSLAEKTAMLSLAGSS